MKRISKLFFALALTISGLTSAYADDPVLRVSTYVPMDAGAPGVFTDTWTLPVTSTGLAGTGFDDGYAFNVVDSAYINVSLSSLLSGVNFTGDGGGIALYYYADYTNNAAQFYTQLATSTTSLTAGSFLLTSGTYVLEVAGTYTVDGGSYAGKIFSTLSPVPEPSAVLMLLLGLATVAGAMRLRQRRL